MYRIVIAALLGLVVAGRAFAAPATLFDGCGMQTADGTCICAERYIVTQPFFPGAGVGTGPWIFHCEGDLGRRLPKVYRSEEVCGVTLSDGTTFWGRLFILATPSGRIMGDCMVQLV